MNPIRRLMSVLSPAYRERDTQTRAACTRAFAACELLPQFVACSHNGKFGLLNTFNGCFVRIAETSEPALLLTWQSSGANGTAHEFFLDEEAQVQRFSAAMREQALVPRQFAPLPPLASPAPFDAESNHAP